MEIKYYNVIKFMNLLSFAGSIFRLSSLNLRRQIVRMFIIPILNTDETFFQNCDKSEKDMISLS